ncbi:MAG: hypothetical protein QW384_06230 [Archaeoglobaceae archaeon]
MRSILWKKVVREFFTKTQRIIDTGNEVHYVATQKMPWVEVDFPHELRIAKRVYESFRAHRY